MSPDQQEASGQPETITFGVKIKGAAIQGGVMVPHLNGAPQAPVPDLGFDPISGSTLAGGVIDSQSGVGLAGLLIELAGQWVPLTSANETGALFDKLGFAVDDLLPVMGAPQGRLGFGHLPYNTIQQKALPKPITTNAFVGASEFQSLSLNRAGMPMYDLGFPTGGGQPQVQSAGIVARNPPAKMTDGYVLIYSDLMTSCSTTYYGGLSNVDLPCAALVSRVDSSGDYTFADQSGWSFTVSKAATLTSIMVDIRRPNGKQVSLKPGSLVIFKISREIEIDPPSTSSK
jgi:hypothetical protein